MTGERKGIYKSKSIKANLNRKPGHWLVGPLIGVLLLGYRVRAVVEIGCLRHDDRSTLAEVMISIISITPMTRLALIGWGGQPIRR